MAYRVVRPQVARTMQIATPNQPNNLKVMRALQSVQRNHQRSATALIRRCRPSLACCGNFFLRDIIN